MRLKLKEDYLGFPAGTIIENVSLVSSPHFMGKVTILDLKDNYPNNDPSRTDSSHDPVFYFGWKQSDGQYIIQKINATNSADIIYSWATGAWTNRLTLIYTE